MCQSVASIFPFTSGFSGVVHTAQVINNAKVSDHHAILPTKEAANVRLGELPTGERNLLALLVVRLLCAVCPDKYRYADTTVMISCGGVEFTAKGHMELFCGWEGGGRGFLGTLREKTEEKPPCFNLFQGGCDRWFSNKKEEFSNEQKYAHFGGTKHTRRS